MAMKQPVTASSDVRAVARAADANAVHAALVAEHLVERRPQVQLHLAVGDLGHHLVDQDRLGAELVAAVDDVHLGGDVRQVQRLLDRGVAAADDAHFLAAVEEAVAGGAAADAAAHERLLGGQPEVLGRRAGGDDQRVAGVAGGVAAQDERRLGQLDLVDVVEHDLGVEALGVLQEALHQVGPHDAVDVGRPVVDVGRRHQLAALGDAGDEHRLQVGARGIDRGRIAGGTGAEDQDAGVMSGQGHGCNVEREERAVWPRRRKSDMGLNPAGINARNGDNSPVLRGVRSVHVARTLRPQPERLSRWRCSRTSISSGASRSFRC